MSKYIYLLIILCICNFCLSKEKSPKVTTPLGKVKGKWKTSRNGQKYAAFEGIPYAKPPVEDLRFEEPEPVLPWTNVLEAYSSPACVQTGKFTDGRSTGNEDCLYLNIYVPAKYVSKKETKKLDVVVTIHGGAFMTGTAQMAKHEILLDSEFVLVSINYRLGLFGFLSTGDGVIPGNNGLKDQVLALQWVKDNIKSFGGNPDSVTISGLSSGGASVHFHYFSSLSKGLFHKGISQSGTALSPWALKRNPWATTKKLAVSLGCPNVSSQELKTCLKQKSVQELSKATAELYKFDRLPISPFGAVMERGGKNPFLKRDPFLLLREGKVLDVPWMASHTADEGILPTGYFYTDLEKVNKNWKKLAHVFLDYEHTLPKSRRQTVATKILDHYLGSGENITKENFDKFTQIFTDREYANPGELSARLQTKVTQSPVYYYFFNYQDGVNKATRYYTREKEVKGVAHGDDGIYFYGLIAGKPFSEKDKNLIKVFQKILLSYASTGKPYFDGREIWEPVGSWDFTYLNITGPDVIKLEKREILSPIDFWMNLGFQEYDNLFVKDEL